MFKSARVKLTLFYLAILLAFSFTLTFSFRVLFEHEFGHSNDLQRGEARQLFLRGLYIPGRPYNDFSNFQQDQAGEVHTRLNEDLFFINIAALIIGGVLSYWFAGRTLGPIEKAHKEQARFAADASHELRTPLTNIKLENEIFLRQKQFGETDARELIQSNLEEVQRLEGLSSNLLALTQYGSTPLNLKTLPVQKIIGDSLQQVKKVAEKRQVQWKEDIAEANIIGDANSLVQLLVILLDNAIKYGPEGGVVSVGSKPEDGHLLVWVQDQGPGIHTDDMPRIFDRLYRGDKARSSKVSGYGLGLSLARAIADANHAELRAQNIPGTKGACFVLRIPLAGK